MTHLNTPRRRPFSTVPLMAGRLVLGLFLSAFLFAACADETRVPDQNYITCHELSCEIENKICNDHRAGRDAFCGDCVDGYTHSDGQCRRVCDDTEYAIHESMGNWTCHKRKACESDEFISNPRPAFDKDYECKTLRECLPGSYVTADPTETSNRECAPCPEGESSDTINATACTDDTPSCPAGHRPSELDDVCQLAFTQVSSSYQFSCAVRVDDGRPVCWGNNVHQQGQPPPELRVLDSGSNTLALGYSHACAIREADKDIVCWGGEKPIENQPGIKFESLSAGKDFTCAIREANKSVLCWGDRPPAIPNNGSLKATGLAAADETLCVITSETGDIQCWDQYGPSQQLTLPENEHFIEIAVGAGFVCGLNQDQNPVCTAINDSAILPAAYGSLRLSELRAYDDTACAIREDTDHVLCWGPDAWDAADSIRNIPTNTPLTHLSVGAAHACGLTPAQQLLCWGQDRTAIEPPTGRPVRDLQLGDTLINTSNVAWLDATDDHLHLINFNPPERHLAPPVGPIQSLQVGPATACSLTFDEDLPTCWWFVDIFGDDDDDDDEGTELYASMLLDIPENIDIASVSLDVTGGCGLEHDTGTPQCWGLDVTGALNPPKGALREIKVTYQYACGLSADQGLPTCWGFTPDPEFIDPDDDDDDDLEDMAEIIDALLNPPAIADLHGLQTQLTYACALDEDGHAICWGDDTHGQASPPPGERFESLSLGGTFSCGLRSDGSVSCWGDVAWTFSIFGGTVRIPLDPPSHLRFSSLTQASDTLCGIIRDTGVEACWGGYARNL